MPSDNNRMLLELDKVVREINREVINPALPELAVDDLRPVLKMVARARASYLRELLEVATRAADALPTSEQVQRLAELRATFEELLNGAQALETAIQRAYLDVRGRA